MRRFNDNLLTTHLLVILQYLFATAPILCNKKDGFYNVIVQNDTHANHLR